MFVAPQPVFQAAKPSSPHTALRLSGLCVRYPNNPRWAVDAVNLQLAAGEIGVLIGPSGCGKTTLLRAIAGLEPYTGKVLIGDAAHATSGSPSAEPHFTSAQLPHLVQAQHLTPSVGMVFQDFALFPHLTVAQNVAFGLHKQPKGVQKLRTAEVLDLVGLQGYEQRLPHELSGGQQQRVALARALAPRPRLLLLDEPFSSLDVDLRERLAHELRAILKAAGATALFVTHDQLEAFAIGDVIGVMQGGQLDQWADAYTLYHRPATRFVADFIGHGVWLGAVGQAGEPNDSRSNEDRVHMGLATPLGWVAYEAAQAGQTYNLLLRADDIVHDDAAPLQAQIVRKAFRGSEFLYTLQTQSGQTLLAHVPSHHDHQLGEPIGIKLELDHVVVFEAEAA